MNIYRKVLLKHLSLIFVFLANNAHSDSERARNLPKRSMAHAEVAAIFDANLQPVIEKWKVPGMSVAVSIDDKIVFARAYGFSDAEKITPLTENHLFRMGSINKTLTAAALLKLVEKKIIGLDDPILNILITGKILDSKPRDDRVSKITLRHLLNHTAGFDRRVSGDPFFQPRLRDVARRQSVAPVTCEAIIRDTLSLPLDFEPGTKYAYSNVGYCILGVIIGLASGESYQSFVNRELLQPAIGKNYRLGHSTQSLQDETKYHMPEGAPKELAAPGISALLGVHAPYGSYSIENMEALGGWVASPIDVLKFFLALDGSRGKPLLSKESKILMLARPSYLPSKGTPTNYYYGFGVDVRENSRGLNWWHSGSQPGVQSLALRTSEGYSWVFALNMRPLEAVRQSFFQDFDRAMWSAARSVRAWPETELPVEIIGTPR